MSAATILTQNVLLCTHLQDAAVCAVAYTARWIVRAPCCGMFVCLVGWLLGLYCANEQDACGANCLEEDYKNPLSDAGSFRAHCIFGKCQTGKV